MGSSQGVLLVTGASGGIGRAIIEQADLSRFAIAVHYHRNDQAASELCDATRMQGGRAEVLQADLGVESDVLTMFGAIDDRLGRVTALVNNAGSLAPISRFDELSAERMENLFRANVLGAFLCAREAIRRMSPRHGGSGGAIVNVSSVAASLGSPGEFVDYAAMKGAIDTFTVGLAKEVAEERIRVNAVRPGLIRTGMHAQAGAPNRADDLSGTIPMKRAGEPAEVAAAILWLLSDEASYVNGATLDVSGGR